MLSKQLQAHGKFKFYLLKISAFLKKIFFLNFILFLNFT